MKIAYFHRLTFEDTEQRFKEEAEKMGIELTFIKYKHLVMESDSVTGINKITFNDIDLKDFDIWFFRSVGSELEWSKILQLYARDNNIPAVDDYILTEGVLKRFKSTMGYILAKESVLYPKTVYFNFFSQVKTYVEKTNPEYPFIVKLSSGGRHGMSTFFVQKFEDLLEIETTLKDRNERAVKEGKAVIKYRGFLLQEYIPNDGDFRVMTVGYKCIGGFKRAPKEEKLVLNKSQGKSAGMKELPADVIEVAEKAGKVLGVEIAGTDLVRSKKDGKVYIVEVNEAPQFKVFEKRTNINAPKMILEYLVKKTGI